MVALMARPNGHIAFMKKSDYFTVWNFVWIREYHPIVIVQLEVLNRRSYTIFCN
jgi:hypothetical protein